MEKSCQLIRCITCCLEEISIDFAPFQRLSVLLLKLLRLRNIRNRGGRCRGRFRTSRHDTTESYAKLGIKGLSFALPEIFGGDSAFAGWAFVRRHLPGAEFAARGQVGCESLRWCSIPAKTHQGHARLPTPSKRSLNSDFHLI